MTGHTETTATASATPQATALYVYGVIPAADARDWPGADGIEGPSATVRTLVAGELAALGSAPPAHPTPRPGGEPGGPRAGAAPAQSGRAAGPVRVRPRCPPRGP